MSEWTPEKEPYRVLATFRSNAYGMYGWRDGRPACFETLEMAEKHASTITNAKSVAIHCAENAATWTRNGKWRLVKQICPAIRRQHA